MGQKPRKGATEGCFLEEKIDINHAESAVCTHPAGKPRVSGLGPFLTHTLKNISGPSFEARKPCHQFELNEVVCCHG
jgi:hypothetical protein